MQSRCLFAFDLQPEDIRVFVCVLLAYFYLHQMWSSLVKQESGISSSALPKRSVSLPVHAVGTVSRVAAGGTVPGSSKRGNREKGRGSGSQPRG